MAEKKPVPETKAAQQICVKCGQPINGPMEYMAGMTNQPIHARMVCPPKPKKDGE